MVDSLRSAIRMAVVSALTVALNWLVDPGGYVRLDIPADVLASIQHVVEFVALTVSAGAVYWIGRLVEPYAPWLFLVKRPEYVEPRSRFPKQ